MSNKADSSITFRTSESKEVGRLIIENGLMTFSGNADEAAKLFFDLTINQFNGACERTFIRAFSAIQQKVNGTAHDKGWYDKPAEDGTRIALMHSELSEALEGLRAGNPPSDKIGDKGFSQVEEEFADCIIRMMDVSEEQGWRIAEAVIAKAEYNKGRSHRHGGKQF